jgi:hypothetical protein
MGLMPRSLLRLILEGNALSFPTTGQANPARRVETTERFPPAEWLGACPVDNDRRSTGGIYNFFTFEVAFQCQLIFLMI